MRMGKCAAGLAIVGLAAGLLAPSASADPNPTTQAVKAFCKAGGWQLSFKNQGQCVAAAEHGFIPYGFG